MKPKTNPFSRFHLFMTAVHALMAKESLPFREALLLQPTAYNSRGHGLNRPNRSLRCVAMAKRAAKKARNIRRHKQACKG